MKIADIITEKQKIIEDEYVLNIIKNILYEKALLKQKEHEEYFLLFETNLFNENILLETGEMDFLTQGGGAGGGKGILGKFKHEMMSAYGADPFSIVDYGNLFASTALKSGTAFMGIFGKPLFGLVGGQGGLNLYKGMESTWNSAIASQFPETVTTSNKDFISQAMPALFLSNPLLAAAAGLTVTLIDKNGQAFPFSIGSGGGSSRSLKLTNIFSGNHLQEYIQSINKKVLPGLRKVDDNVNSTEQLKARLEQKLKYISSDAGKITKMQQQLNSGKGVGNKILSLKIEEFMHFMTILRMIKDGKISGSENIASIFELTRDSFKIIDKNEVSAFFSGVANIVSSFSYDNIEKNKLGMYKAAAISLINFDRKKALGKGGQLGAPVRTFKSGRRIEYDKDQLAAMFNDAERIIKSTTEAQLDNLLKSYSSK
jgi:hypothetical protein